ncbi:MAG: Rnf-Nqr domain containing protein [candidate division WOR-3 bacterium]
MNAILSLLWETLTKNNVCLYYLLGICPLLLYNLNLGESFITGLVIILLMVLGNWVVFIIEKIFLLPLGLSYMQISFFVLIIYLLLYYSKIMVKRLPGNLSDLFDNYPEFFFTNYAIYGVIFLNRSSNLPFWETTVASFGFGFGYLVILVLFMLIKEKMNINERMPIPVFRQLLILSLMSLVFMSLIFKQR